LPTRLQKLIEFTHAFIQLIAQVFNRRDRGIDLRQPFAAPDRSSSLDSAFGQKNPPRQRFFVGVTLCACWT
jgi:hypothetical protein